MIQKLRVSNRKGFTLIELFIVLAIIGILLGIAIPSFLSQRDRTYNQMAYQDALNALKEAGIFVIRKGLDDLTEVNGYGFKCTVSNGVEISVTNDETEFIVSKHRQGSKTWIVSIAGGIVTIK